jgi:hypothetical protein
MEWGILLATFALAILMAKVITYFIDKNIPTTERDY